MSPDKPRRRPYIWPSWITKLLSGENKCWWAAWFKAHHYFEKVKDDFPNREEWIRKHDAIRDRRAQEFRDDGYVVKIEDEGSFKLSGEICDVSGKPDIVAMKDGSAIVSDAKAGKRKKGDHWQVRLYQFALPMSWLRDHELTGEVAYADEVVPVAPPSKSEREMIIQGIRIAGGKEEPDTVPSKMECRYCDVAACPMRYQEPVGDASELW